MTLTAMKKTMTTRLFTNFSKTSRKGIQMSKLLLLASLPPTREGYVSKTIVRNLVCSICLTSGIETKIHLRSK